MRYTFLLSLFITVFAMSCTNGKQTNTSEANSEKEDLIKKKTEALIQNGFVKGVVTDQTKLDGCGFMIQLEDENKTILWVPKLDESYKVDGKEVWVKYRPSKMPSTCMKGIPAIIEEIKQL